MENGAAGAQSEAERAGRVASLKGGLILQQLVCDVVRFLILTSFPTYIKFAVKRIGQCSPHLVFFHA